MLAIFMSQILRSFGGSDSYGVKVKASDFKGVGNSKLTVIYNPKRPTGSLFWILR